MTRSEQPAGVIIAGGNARRMQGRHKPLLELQGRSLLSHIIERAAPQVERLLLNVNDPGPYRDYGLEIVTDEHEDAGPLAGICAAMRWQHRHGAGRWLACFPGDVPFFPPDTVARLQAAREAADTELAWLQTDAQPQPLFSLWSLSLLPAVETALTQGIRSPLRFIRSRRHALQPVAAERREDYCNINSPEELRPLQAWLKENERPA